MFKTFCQTLLLVSLSRQACLEEAALKSLGFTNVKTEPEKITDAKYCTERFAEHGICVDISEFEAIINKDQDAIEENTD